MRSIFHIPIIPLALLLHLTSCLEHAQPVQTVVANDFADALGWTPKPTVLPGIPALGRMRRRDDPVPSGTCGYVTQDECQ